MGRRYGRSGCSTDGFDLTCVCVWLTLQRPNLPDWVLRLSTTVGLRLVGNKWEGLTILSSADGFDARDGRVQHNVLTDICSLSRRGCPSSMPGSLHVNELLKATAADVRAACE